MKISSKSVSVKPSSRPQLPGRPLSPPKHGPIGLGPFPGGRVTLSLKDRFTAARLPAALQRDLSGLGGKLRLASAPDATLRRGKDGSMVGPEGQPLVPVNLKNGKTAYVDPNTNQYYVAENNLRYLRAPDSLSVKGPISLPEGAQFSNSHFSAADCRELSRAAREGVFHHADGFQPDFLHHTHSGGCK